MFNLSLRKKKKQETNDIPNFNQPAPFDQNMTPPFLQDTPPQPFTTPENNNPVFPSAELDSPFKKEPEPKYSTISNKEEMEEIADSIFSEKTEELIKKLDEVKNWQKKVISRLDLEEKEIGYLRASLNGLRDNMFARIDDCRNRIKEIGVEVKVIEKVFSEIMPTFVEKIKEFSEEIDRLKGINPKIEVPKPPKKKVKKK